MIEVRTSEYRFDHGHEPRGRGRWAFGIPTHIGSTASEHVEWFEGTFSEAKRQAVASAKRSGARWVTVLP